MNRLKLTADGVIKLEKEIDNLSLKRDELREKLRDSVSQGYDSEDIDMSLDYSELARIENRIAELEVSLRTAETIDPQDYFEMVALGHHVTIKGQAGEIIYQLVESIEADPSHGKISVDSPLGQSLLGKKLSDVIHVASKLGNKQYEIVGIQ